MRQVLNLYLISQVENLSDEAYQACLVAEESIVKARNTLPKKLRISKDKINAWVQKYWTNPENVRVKYIGEAADDMAIGVCLKTNNHFHN